MKLRKCVDEASRKNDILAEIIQPNETANSSKRAAFPTILLKTFSSRAKSKLTPKRSPSTSQRGAQILELSRKIHNEPSNKRSHKEELSPKDKQPTSKLANTTSSTPESSPARAEKWLRHTYSPYASPSSGILKKKLNGNDDIDDLGEGSPGFSKSRRVSFADPEVSRSVTIQSTPKRLSRTRRSLITTYNKSVGVGEQESDGLKDSNVEEVLRHVNQMKGFILIIIF